MRETGSVETRTSLRGRKRVLSEKDIHNIDHKNLHIVILTKKDLFFTKDTNQFTLPPVLIVNIFSTQKMERNSSITITMTAIGLLL